MDNSIKGILYKYKNILKNEGFETYSLDVELLLMAATNKSKIEIYTLPDYQLSENEHAKFSLDFKRRLKKEPLAYILNNVEFMALNFFVNKDVLIPRPDTEILVEKAIDIINLNKFKSVLEIGSGSGAIAISLAKYCHVNVDSVDISHAALDVAVKNASLNNIENKVKFFYSDLFQNVKCKYDMIISNPPYIKTQEIHCLQDSVKLYEPKIALDGGDEGIDFYKKIIYNAKDFLNKSGHLLFEIGFEQAEEVRNLLLDCDFYNIKILKDFSGLNRVILATVS